MIHPIYAHLADHQWKSFWRKIYARSNPIVWALFGVLGIYLAFVLFIAGRSFGLIVFRMMLVHDPVELLNEYMLSMLLSLLGLRLLFQKSPRMKLRPYVHLPIPRKSLVGFFQVSSFFTLHNFYPLIFLFSFWYYHVRPVNALDASACWLLGAVGLFASSTYFNNWIRTVIARRERQFFAMMIALWVVMIFDHLFGAGTFGIVSSYVFNALLDANWYVAAALVLLPALPLRQAQAMLLESTYSFDRSLTQFRRVPSWTIPFLSGGDMTTQLLLLEFRMMLRNDRPRHYVLISIIFSTFYLVFLLISESIYGGLLIGAVVGLFASGGFAMNYGQLMFSWESTFFDGLVARDVRPDDIIRSKLYLLQGSCFLFFVMSVPIFLLLRPDLLLLHIAFLCYNVGVTSVLTMFLAVNNRKRIDISRGDSLFNYEGISLAHWLWIFPIGVPPTVVLVALRHAPIAGALMVAGIGMIGFALTPVWIESFKGTFLRRRYLMATGFRTT